MARLVGISRQELSENEIASLFASDPTDWLRQLRRVVHNQKEATPHLHNLDSGKYLQVIGCPCGKELCGRLFADESSLVQAQETLTYLSEHDLLTGINNRNSYFSRVEELSRHPQKYLGIGFLDINALKSIKDTHGPQAGDQVILFWIQQLKRYFPVEFLYHISGDKFLVVDDIDDRRIFLDKMQGLHEDL